MDATHARGGLAAIVTTELAKRDAGVGYPQGRKRGRDILADHRGAGLFAGSDVDELVAVEVRSFQRDEEITFLQRARIGAYSGKFRIAAMHRASDATNGSALR